MSSLFLTVDVAHPPRHPDRVEGELLDAWSAVRNSPTQRVLKIIHGHGSTGRGGSTRDVVRNWVYRRKREFKAVIVGENYSLLDASTQELRKTLGDYRDEDLDRANPGITIVWVK